MEDVSFTAASLLPLALEARSEDWFKYISDESFLRTSPAPFSPSRRADEERAMLLHFLRVAFFRPLCVLFCLSFSTRSEGISSRYLSCLCLHELLRTLTSLFAPLHFP